MIVKCGSERDLEVHHKRIDGGNDLDNAEVLCGNCHKSTSTYGRSDHRSPPPFSQETKTKALKWANYQCECTRKECSDHHKYQ